MKTDSIYQSKWLPIFTIGVLLILVYKLSDNYYYVKMSISHFLRIVSPFLFGILICYFLYIPCKKLEQIYMNLNFEFSSKNARFLNIIFKFISKKARLFSVLSVYFIVILLISVFITFVIPIIITSLLDLAREMPTYFNYILSFIKNLVERTGFANLDVESNLIGFVQSTLTHFFDPSKIEQFTKSVIGFVNGFIRALISLVVSFYILLDREKIRNFFNQLSDALFKEKIEKQLKKYLHQANTVLFIFIASKGLDSIINAFVVTLILLIVNVKYALLLGLIAGVANFIPYLGSLVAVIFICLLSLLTGGVDTALKTLVLLAIFQQLDANFIEPKIMGESLKINPILVISSVIIAGAYFGVVGMFLAVPAVTVLQQLSLEYIESKKTRISVIDGHEI